MGRATHSLFASISPKWNSRVIRRVCVQTSVAWTGIGLRRDLYSIPLYQPPWVLRIQCLPGHPSRFT